MSFTDWKSYKEDTPELLNRYLTTHRNEKILGYLKEVFLFYSYLTEDVGKKITNKNKKNIYKNISVFLVETQDLMRGIHACYEQLTLAPLALFLRTSFEIHCNLKYITASTEPLKYADLYNRFQIIEEMLGYKISPDLVKKPAEKQLEYIIQQCPEWFKLEKKELVENMPHWTAIKGMNLYKICEKIRFTDKYNSLYRAYSKFTHASPLIRNLYLKNGMLAAIPNSIHSTRLALLGISECMDILKVVYSFFELSFPEDEYSSIYGPIMSEIDKLNTI